MSHPDPNRDRALAFLRRTDMRESDRVEPFRDGATVLTDGAPRVWNANHVRLDEPWTGTADELDAELGKALRGRGLAHQMVVIHHEQDARRLEPGLRRLGYVSETHTVMGLRREAGRAASAPVEDVPARVAGAIRARVGLQVHDRLRDRWLAAFDHGRPAACARILSDGSTGQVEDVATLPGRRNRGLATSVVLGGIDRLHAEGVGLVLIVVDRDSGPIGLYRDLGFDPVTAIVRFRRT